MTTASREEVLRVDPLDGEHPASASQTTRRKVIKAGLASGLLLAGAGAIGWTGLQVQPGPFPDPDVESAQLQTSPMPADLPPPVERFYRTLYGTAIPRIEGAIISGRGTMRVSGITLPVRFRFTHDTGVAYRHQIEITLFGRHVMTVDESFIDGTCRLELPFGTGTGPNIDQGANLALWAEAIWMPAVWLSDRRVRWEAIDESTAALIVPYAHNEEQITLFFNAETTLIDRLESMRFKAEADDQKTLWINEVVRWETIDGRLLPLETTVRWADESSPWARLSTDSVVYTAEVTKYLLPNDTVRPAASPAVDG